MYVTKSYTAVYYPCDYNKSVKYSYWSRSFKNKRLLLFNQKIILDTNFAIFNSTDYYNALTKRYDPINAPKFKFNASLKWDSKIGNLMFSYRYVDKFNWMDGIWEGVIGPYNIFDIHYNLKITENLGLSVSAMNIFNDVHRELIGGAKMGRQIVFRLTSTF